MAIQTARRKLTSGIPVYPSAYLKVHHFAISFYGRDANDRTRVLIGQAPDVIKEP
jgi:hypothetical protein